MNDDYDLEYTYNNHNRAYDLDEIYDMWVQSCTSLDEDVQQEDDYARDTDTYETLAYRHYAWYNSTSRTRTMYINNKRTVCVTLDVECYDDLPLEDMDWKELLGLEGDEDVKVNIKELVDVY